MKELLLVVLLLISGYLGYQLNETKLHLASTNSELEKTKREMEELYSSKTVPDKNWLQKKILDRSSSLEAGAYNQKAGVARRASIYYAPVNTVNDVRIAPTQGPTPEQRNTLRTP